MISALALLAVALPFVTAEVFPNFPAGDVLRSGQNCHIAWAGDTASTTTWKDMSIQFMTGPNLNMVHITTVALHLDGTQSGTFDWTCPEVTDNSAIYFYQFTSPKSVNTQWTTRFTIASATGATNAPPNALHPNGLPPAWGTGALKNPSQATPPPVYGTPTDPGVPGPTPTNVAPGVAAGCSNWYNRNDGLLCWQIVERFGITLDQFASWNGANVCNALQDNKSYCVKNTGTPTDPGTPGSTPTNVAPGIGAGCTQFFTETNLLCFEIASQFGITVEQFESWNGAGVCSRLQTGLAYCVKGGTAAQPTPTNVAPGVVAGCTGFFVETNLLCWQIAQQFGITVAQFESWNGANVCNVLQSGQAYCIAGPAATRPANAHPGATSSCRQWFNETNLLCWQIAEQFGITVAQFESWNGAGVCNILQSGTAYCVGA